jgi:hydroxymethylpyrimidine pyrophosphatase-like HAD family hydrolase
MKKTKLAIFDIDNTIFNSNFVWGHLRCGCKTFTEVYEKFGDLNIPIYSTINLIKQLNKQGIRIALLTARPIGDLDITKNNLRRFIPDVPHLIKMVGYNEGIDERKKEAIEKWQELFEVLLFMDDDKKNRDIVSEMGILTLDVLGI